MVGEWKTWNNGLRITDYNQEVGGTSHDAMPAGWSALCLHRVSLCVFYLPIHGSSRGQIVARTCALLLALFPGPPSFLSLAVWLSTSDEKLGVGLGTRLHYHWLELSSAQVNKMGVREWVLI